MNGDSSDPDFCCGSVSFFVHRQFLQVIQRFPSINHPVVGKEPFGAPL